jgi:dTDP-4-dehydrorhamnose 3,5-epimerase
MIFTETKLAGAYLINVEPFEDHRGFFALSWSQTKFAALELDSRLAECNISFNKKKGTLRGMHYQEAPSGQAKLVRCTRGAIYDVMIDLRPSSSTFKQWMGLELTQDNYRMLYIPQNFAHGFQTLADNTEVFYQMSSPYVLDSARGVRWDDPAFGIDWPPAKRIIIARDQEYPDFAG